MSIYSFFNLLLSQFGISILDFTDLVASFPLDKWFNLLQPDLLMSLIVTFVVFYIILYTVIILPFRLFKRVIKAPDSKGRVKR